MCIIVYKCKDVDFPSKATLKTCFTNNQDGAGFMYARDNKVYIQKGFMTFKKFWHALQKVRKDYGDKMDYVMHFRITTQAGVRQDCTHPYPLSKNMDDLRELETTCNIGVAHNGIIDLTSHYGGYYGGYNGKNITHNDTMEFITDYLSLIIKDKNFYKDNDTLELITKLCGSKLAILSGDGICTLIGEGWQDHNGVKYSNNSYMSYTKKLSSPVKSNYSYDYYDKYNCDCVYGLTYVDDGCKYCQYNQDCEMYKEFADDSILFVDKDGDNIIDYYVEDGSLIFLTDTCEEKVMKDNIQPDDEFSCDFYNIVNEFGENCKEELRK